MDLRAHQVARAGRGWPNALRQSAAPRPAFVASQLTTAP
eukprot:jgi/Mesen1/1640/ME000135S00638